MNKSTRSKTGRIVASIAAAAMLAIGLSACSGLATPTGMCGWVVGDGQNNNDAKIHDTVWPDEKVSYDSSSEVAHFVPCGPRNYIITDGGDRGDSQKPLEALTKSGTPVKVTLDALWQLNQDEATLAKFAELCNKYECYTTDAASGDANFATEGWNGMLEENFRPAIQNAVNKVMPEFDDDIWQKQSPEMLEDFQKKVSEAFMETVRARTGYDVDPFCGSGNSAWSDPETPGAKDNTFNCSQVRFDSASVKATKQETQDSASAANQKDLNTAANQARYDEAVPLYGPEGAHYWLGVQDAAAKCTGTCNFYFGTPPVQ